MKIFSGIQPTGDKHLGNLIGGFRQYAATQEQGEAYYLHRRPALDHGRVRPRRPARADARPGRDAVRHRARPGALDGLLPEPRHGARRGGMAALGRDELRPVGPHDAVQGQGRAARVRLRRPLHLPGADGRRHPALPDRRRPDRRRPAAAPRAGARHRRALQRAIRRDVRRAERASTPRSARGSWTCRSRRRRCRRPAARPRARSGCSTIPTCSGRSSRAPSPTRAAKCATTRTRSRASRT